MRALFRNKNFSLLFFGNLVSSIGNTFYNFAISWYILELTGSALQAGTYMATGGVIYIIMTPFAGVITDRFDKVKIVYLTDFIRGIAIILAGLGVGLNLDLSTTLWLLYAATIILSINGTLFQPAVTSLQADVLSESDYQSANASMSLIRSVEGIIGILLAGILYSILGVSWIFIINGISFILSGVSEMFITFNYESKGELSWKQGLEDLLDGFQYLAKKQGLLRLMIMILLINFAFVPMFANVLPFMFNQQLQATPFQFSVVQLSMSVGILLSAVLISNLTKQLQPRGTLMLGLTLMILIYFVMTGSMYLIMNNEISFVLFWIIASTLMFLFGVVNIFVNTPISTTFMKTIEPAYRGRSNATISVMSMALIPLATFLGGLLIEIGSVLYVGFFGSGLLIVLWIYFRQDKKIRSYLEVVSK
jgi:MFS transporter, DHA3 family, macrolide efflux protein